MTKLGIALPWRLLGAASCLLTGLSACSSSDGTASTPPSGGSSGQASGGSGGEGGSSGGMGGMSGGGTGGSGGTCSPDDCLNGQFCFQNACVCPTGAPDLCPTEANVCVDKQNDPNNCGDCGMMCDPGAPCVTGQCGTAPTELTTATGCGSIELAVQGGNLYWTETMSGAVRSIPIAGGAAVAVATGQLSPTQIAADANGVYWTDQGDGTEGSSKLMKKALPLTAAAPITLATATGTDPITHLGLPILAIAVSANKLYYTLGNDVHQISTDETVTTDVIVGTATNYDPATPVKAGLPSALAVNASMVVWATLNRNGVEGDDLDPETTLDDRTGYVELGESVGNLLLSNVGIDSTYAYWADGDKFVRNKLNAATPQPVETFVWEVPDFTSPITAFAIGATDVYAGVGMDDNSLYKHPLVPSANTDHDTALVKVATGQTNITSVVLDATNVYWATDDCAIRYTAQ